MSGDVALVSVLERLVTAVEQLVNGLESQKKLLAQTKPALTIEKPHEELAAWLPTLETKRKMDGTASEALTPVPLCRYCANEIASSARFCDHCGMVNVALVCRCGNELATSERFCDRCGRGESNGRKGS